MYQFILECLQNYNNDVLIKKYMYILRLMYHELNDIVNK